MHAEASSPAANSAAPGGSFAQNWKRPYGNCPEFASKGTETDPSSADPPGDPADELFLREAFRADLLDHVRREKDVAVDMLERAAVALDEFDHHVVAGALFPSGSGW